jgi:uncharacterized protein YceH (UPF0502 family)
MAKLRALDDVEQRVIGCLVEKELTTPDLYPLTVNALVAACNQSSNRDPVMRLGPEDVEPRLHALMGELLVWRERGARTLRWKHQLERRLGVDPAGKAVLAELLLRGEQTPGELRARAGRMTPFSGLGEVEAVLTELAAHGLVEELPRSPGQKERRWRHRLADGLAGSAEEAAAEPRERHLEVPPSRAPSAATSSFDPPPRPPAAERAVNPRPPASPAVPDELDSLRARLATLEARVEELSRRLEDLGG